MSDFDLKITIQCLAERITKLENSKRLEQETYAGQIIEASIISSIHKRLDACEQNYPSLWKRIEKLENYMTMEDRVTASDVLLRLTKIETLVQDIISAPNVVWGKYNKTPHKCPICDGRGDYRRFNPEPSNGYIDCICTACDKTGIVWG